MADDKNNPETPESGSPRPANDQPAAGDGGPADPADPADPLDPAEARIAELEAELAALKDSSLRALAETENIRKRAERQVADANRYGAVSLARDMLSISDNLRRA
ncbi:MAG: nucleotide exchange factor GrpE, partial [Bauldia litoralis]